jgi:hypothetical protein
VSVYAGVDPITRREIRFRGTAKSDTEAKIVLGKLLEKAAEGRRPESGVLVAKLLDEYAAIAEWDVTTQQTNEGFIRRTIKPALGHLEVRKVRGPISTADAHREYPDTIVSTGSCFAVLTCPHPTGTVISGNQKSSWASSPAAYEVRDAGSGGRYAGRSSATRVRSVRSEYGHPIRSATTLAGIDGYALSSSRIRGSNASATDPFGSRTYFGGPSDRSAARTVLRDTFLIRAICLIGSPSARCSCLISAQSSTSITCFLPDPFRARIPGRRVKFRLPRWGQYSASVDKRHVSHVFRIIAKRSRSRRRRWDERSAA